MEPIIVENEFGEIWVKSDPENDVWIKQSGDKILIHSTSIPDLISALQTIYNAQNPPEVIGHGVIEPNN
jgi:hypothetical protein